MALARSLPPLLSPIKEFKEDGGFFGGPILYLIWFRRSKFCVPGGGFLLIYYKVLLTKKISPVARVSIVFFQKFSLLRVLTTFKILFDSKIVLRLLS